eukprot:CAMPEP_0177637468 /NCGR_PEP_ID=MMETSP0447-20121125/4986_1 /TAXON_ID=0 /ORGANISM="Stygamoeba regulata, Strain BSH-02190019" /LENGTH=533 /DNA_ID=CAMNT_0019139395 /DNA_START=73 /DNA_END=1671 /DNA_ORIENTATION=-
MSVIGPREGLDGRAASRKLRMSAQLTITTGEPPPRRNDLLYNTVRHNPRNVYKPWMTKQRTARILAPRTRHNTRLPRVMALGGSIRLIEQGTIPDILNFLLEDGTDRMVVEVFILCHRYLISTPDLLALLRSRIQDGSAAALALLADWVSFNLHEFIGHARHIAQLLDVLTLAERIGLTGKEDSQWTANSVKMMLIRAAQARPRIAEEMKLQLDRRPSMERVVLRNLDRISAHDLAVHFTLKEYVMYCAIPLLEVLYYPRKKARHIEAMVNHSNKVSYWIATQILSKERVSSRAHRVTKYIECMEECLKIQNYNTMMEIMAALNIVSVSRLKKTWELVPLKTLNSFRSMERLMDTRSNYSEYRSQIETAESSCLPFLGVFLRDLTFIQEGKTVRTSTHTREPNANDRCGKPDEDTTRPHRGDTKEGDDGKDAKERADGREKERDAPMLDASTLKARREKRRRAVQANFHPQNVSTDADLDTDTAEDAVEFDGEAGQSDTLSDTELDCDSDLGARARGKSVECERPRERSVSTK